MENLDFIRQLINIIDKHTEPEESEQEPEFIAVSDDEDGDEDHDIKNPMDKDDIFIPPLQQRIEMLKKMTGIEPKGKEIVAHVDGDAPLDD